jgi:hypothetical protein
VLNLLQKYNININEYQKVVRVSLHFSILCRVKLALTSPTSGGRSVGIVRLLTKATEFSFSSGGLSFPCAKLITCHATKTCEGVRGMLRFLDLGTR